MNQVTFHTNQAAIRLVNGGQPGGYQLDITLAILGGKKDHRLSFEADNFLFSAQDLEFQVRKRHFISLHTQNRSLMLVITAYHAPNLYRAVMVGLQLIYLRALQIVIIISSDKSIFGPLTAILFLIDLNSEKTTLSIHTLTGK